MKPILYLVAGAPGSGKSRAFPVSDFGVDFFNADDRAAVLNGGSYHGIPMSIRATVTREFEQFIAKPRVVYEIVSQSHRSHSEILPGWVSLALKEAGVSYASEASRPD